MVGRAVVHAMKLEVGAGECVASGCLGSGTEQRRGCRRPSVTGGSGLASGCLWSGREGCPTCSDAHWSRLWVKVTFTGDEMPRDLAKMGKEVANPSRQQVLAGQCQVCEARPHKQRHVVAVATTTLIANYSTFFLLRQGSRQHHVTSY
jgi:hypothetical protein